jgi:hypothetical protein
LSQLEWSVEIAGRLGRKTTTAWVITSPSSDGYLKGFEPTDTVRKLYSVV